MKLDQYVAKHARETPQRIALEEKSRSISYAHLDEDINTIATEIEDFDQCKFAIFAESGIEYIRALMAVYRSNNIAVPLPVELTESNIQQILDSNRINNIIVTEQQYSRFESTFFDRFSTLIRISKDSSVKNLRKNVISENNNDLLRLVMYTSGTTGAPKGVMLSDENLISNANSIIEVLSITPEDKAAQVISPHHAFGNSIVNSQLVAGGSIAIGGLTFLKSTFELIESGVTIFYGVPSTYRILLKYPSSFQKAFRNVRLAASAGGAMETEITKKIKELNENIEIIPMYGQTEATARLAYVPSEELEEYSDTIGRPIPGVELDVVDDNRNTVEPGITGELIARGKNILIGYLNDEEATRKKIIDGWMYTGDLAQKLPNGYFKLLGRKDDLIKVADHRINPREVEKYIGKNNEVSDVFVVPVDHEYMGNAISLMVIPTEDTEVETLYSFCRKNLPGFLCPLEIILIENLPLSKSGKISNRSIIEAYQNVKTNM
ncbi:class I adenylate-forming enzyme family protein [Methanococcoides methylutens]|uniref:Long-chain-fatty-acid--CoA ligase n=1 Tax=Methanococcoides methylutens MM1 TaxID=1434104 RepID=A0A0E3SSL6_METMT|nr:class I adenylate-forming enzyme family protein [Methanococcoides methylutens]AKB85442.1 Long-chain-fatty-acid--CoA ligase [Methanococcoides methylutens MM1]